MVQNEIDRNYVCQNAFNGVALYEKGFFSALMCEEDDVIAKNSCAFFLTLKCTSLDFKLKQLTPLEEQFDIKLQTECKKTLKTFRITIKMHLVLGFYFLHYFH